MGKIETLGKYLREAETNPEKPEDQEPTPDTAEKSLSAREIGARNRQVTGEKIKMASKSFSKLGGKVWSGLKRVGGAGLDYAFYAPTAARKGAQVAGRGIARGAEFAATAPDRAIDAIGDGIYAGVELAGKAKKRVKKAAVHAKDWTDKKMIDAQDWTELKYLSLREEASEGADRIIEGAGEAKQAFIKRKNSALEWFKNMRQEWGAARKEKRIVRLQRMEFLNQVREKKANEKAKRIENIQSLQLDLANSH